jgi:hypothetical protein
MHHLIQLRGLPNCTTLGISTDGEDDFGIRGGWSENTSADVSFYVFAELETYDQVRKAEGKYAWRQAHAEV